MSLWVEACRNMNDTSFIDPNKHQNWSSRENLETKIGNNIIKEKNKYINIRKKKYFEILHGVNA